MSMQSAAWFLGIALGTNVGGLALLWLDYKGVGLSLGAISLAAALIFYLLIIDPMNTPSTGSKS